MITKTMANELAFYLTAKKRVKRDEIKSKLDELIIARAKELTPPEIVELAEKQPQFFHKTHVISVYVLGHHYRVRDENKKMIVKYYNEHGMSVFFIKGDEVTPKITSTYKTLLNINDNLDKIVESLVDALLHLKTQKNIIAEFPEAEGFFESKKVKKQSTAIAIDYKKLRSLLN